MNQPISFVTTDPIFQRYEALDKFKLRKDRPAVWLQRFLFWMLRKLRCYAMDESVTFKRYVLEPRKFMENLYQQNSHLLEFYSKRGEFLFVGAKDFAELMNDKDTISHMIAFRADYHNGTQIAGMKVVVVPWMQGILVMPQLPNPTEAP